MALFSKKSTKKSGSGKHKLAIFIGYWGNKPEQPATAKEWEITFKAALPQVLKMSEVNKNVSPEDVVVISPDKWFDKNIKDDRYPTRIIESCAKALTYLEKNYPQGITISSSGNIEKPTLVGGTDVIVSGYTKDGTVVDLVYYFIPVGFEPPYKEQYTFYQNEDGDLFTDMGLTEILFALEN